MIVAKAALTANAYGHIRTERSIYFPGICNNQDAASSALRVRGLGKSMSSILPILACGPLVIITTRSANKIASSTSWVTTIAVTWVRSQTSINTSCNSQRVKESSMPKGSSSNSNLGDKAKARAIPTRCRIPLDISPAFLCMESPKPTRVR